MSTEQLLFESPIGVINVSGSDNCITEVSFMKDDHAERLPVKAVTSNVMTACIKQLTEYFAGDISGFDLPLDQEGTHFQKRVWNSLNLIPYGKKISYFELSKQLGDTKAIRAVGTANSKNKIAIIVPCHRVIGSNGSLVGYAGELWRKKWLLDHEAKYAHGVQKLFHLS